MRPTNRLIELEKILELYCSNEFMPSETFKVLAKHLIKYYIQTNKDLSVNEFLKKLEESYNHYEDIYKEGAI